MRIVLLTLVVLLTAGCSLSTPWSVEHDLRRLETLRASAQRSILEKQYAEAENSLEQAVALARQLPDQTKLAETLQQVGELNLLQGKPFKAIATLGEACAIYRKTNLNESLKLRYALALSTLGQAHEVIGSHDDAQHMQTEALETLPSSEQGQTDSYRREKALILQRLGAVQLSNGRFEPAESAFKEALQLTKNVSGTSEIQIDALKGYAQLLKESGRESEIPVVKSRLALLDKSPTSTGDQEAWSKLMLEGKELETSGEHEASDKARWEALRMAEKFGPCDARYGETIRVLAYSFVLREEWKQAEPLLHRSYKLEKECHGPESAEVLLPLARLAGVHTSLGDLEKAEKYAQKALTILQKQTTVSHTTNCQVYHRLAQIRHKQKKLSEALDWEKKALAEFDQITQGSNFVHLQLEQGLARIYRDMNNLPQTEKSLRTVLDIVEQEGVGSHIVFARLSLANCLEEEGKSKEAAALYKDTIEIGEASLQSASEFSRKNEITQLRKALRRTLKLYCALLEKKNDQQQIAKYRKRIAELSAKKGKEAN